MQNNNIYIYTTLSLSLGNLIVLLVSADWKKLHKLLLTDYHLQLLQLQHLLEKEVLFIKHNLIMLLEFTDLTTTWLGFNLIQVLVDSICQEIS